MTLADWIIVAVILGSTIEAAIAGFFQVAFGIGGLVFGYLFATWRYQWAAGWYSRYLKSPEGESGEVAWDLMRLAWSSAAALTVAPLQDLLNLGPEARMNVPGRAEGNWTWRCTKEMLSAADFHSLRDLTRSSKRLGTLRAPLTSEMAEAAS